MSAANLGVLFIGSRRALPWSWLSMHSRATLAKLDDRMLQDIGMSRCSDNFEAAKAFWQA